MSFAAKIGVMATRHTGMTLLTSLTVFAPTLAIVLFADARLKREASRAQLKVGGLLLLLTALPIIGLFSFVPGGSLSDVPLSIKPRVDYILTLALSPVIAVLVLAVSLIGRGLWKSDRQQDQSSS
jgi:hypothetical protein